MSNYPGGGFSEVDGYNPPAGSQAEEQRLMREDEARRQQQEADRYAAEAQMEAMRDVGRSRPSAARSRAASRPARSTPARKKAAPPQDWNAGFAVVGFVAGGLWCASLVEADAKWFAGIIGGVFAGALAGRLYKQIIAAGILAIGLVVWSKIDTPDAKPPSPISPIRATGSSVAPPRRAAASPAAVRTAPIRWTSPFAGPLQTALLPRRPPPKTWKPPVPDTTPLPPGIRGRLFKATDFAVASHSASGKAALLRIYHEPVVDYPTISYLIYDISSRRVTVVRHDGTRLDLGAPIGDSLQGAWEKLGLVDMVRTRDGKCVSGHRFMLLRVP